MSEKTDPKETVPAPAGPPPPSVGASLRQRRQMRGQSLEAVHQSTRIPRGLLQALEEDRFSDFPAPVYLRSFLKTYCEHLELEFEPLWRRAMPEPRTEDETPPKRLATSGPTLPLTTGSMAPFLVVGGLLAAGIVVWGVTRLTQAPRPPRPVAPEPVLEATSLPVEAPAATATVTASPAFEGPERPDPRAPQRLLVTATAAGFVRLSRDGKLVFEGRLPPGKYLDWRGNSFELSASNPAGLRVELDGAVIDLGAVKPQPDGAYRLGKR
ncbi:MAG: DUF4115 domain-containing protein [Elusimicrobia bacterium]|nr:DUF4115 domain-containing protein [Elusimicrobiota bacterium]